MSLPALIGFAGVLVAAVATGLLAGRAVRQPRPDTILWTAATLALTIALAAQSMGFASGFGAATFRAVQLFALMLTPLWLAWGLVEQGWPSEAARVGSEKRNPTVTNTARPTTAVPSSAPGQGPFLARAAARPMLTTARITATACTTSRA